MCALLLVLCLCFSSIEGQKLELRKSEAEVNEFEPLTLMCDTDFSFFNEIDWIRNNKSELYTHYWCKQKIESVHYNISCLPHQQYDMTINNVTRFNHGDRWHCRGDNHFQSNDVQVLVKVPITSVELTQPLSKFVTVSEEDKVYFECVTSPGYPASVITWCKVTNGSEVIISADGSSIGELNDKTIVTTSWLALNFRISDDWTFVYCTANNSARILTSRNRAAVHVHKHNKETDNVKMDNSRDDPTLAKAAITLSTITGTTLVFLIVGYFVIKKLRSSKANQRENVHTSESVTQANGPAQKNSSYTTSQVYENTTQSEPCEDNNMAEES
ncbi:hypothetical protein MAR_031805 [Mya arenaria]|uniref:CD80-like immunoglobulin C2-set domain-containing protein n=1 Tax=Mya arenaria TaxID=6604 RepID=A0ABY7F8U4_MYAAR|nr:hypothetical protein MAR_031805 [Mya arenaria]